MEEHKVIIVVVILGIAAIVMMGLVAKVALLETQVASAPRMHDNLKRQNVPGAKNRPRSAGGSSEGGETDASYAPPPSMSPSAGKPKLGQGATYGLPQTSSESSSAPAAASNASANNGFAAAEKSVVRVTAVDHREEKNGIALAVGEGGVLLINAPLLAGAYEAWGAIPGTRRKTRAFNRCITHSPESRLALVRVDAQDQPLPPAPLASEPPSKGARLAIFHETGQLDIGRAEGTVQALLSSGDVAKKLQVDVPDVGDGLWMEILGEFPQNVFGAPLINQLGQLAGVVLLDSKGTAAPALPAGTRFGQTFGSGGASRPAGISMRRVYAVSHEALAPMLEKASSPANEILFTLEVSPLQKPRDASARREWSVRLASGETIDGGTFEAPLPGAGSGTLKYPDGRKCATLSLSERKSIDGTLIVYGSDGAELLRESFAQGRREGSLTVSTPAGHCLLAAQFRRDVRHGYCVYFRDGAPWLIQEYLEGSPGPQHLVKEGAVFHTVPAGQTLPAITAVLGRYGDWSEWESRLATVEAAIERWAKEAARAGRPRPDQLNVAQREAVAAIEELRKLAE